MKLVGRIRKPRNHPRPRLHLLRERQSHRQLKKRNVGRPRLCLCWTHETNENSMEHKAGQPTMRNEDRIRWHKAFDLFVAVPVTYSFSNHKDLLAFCSLEENSLGCLMDQLLVSSCATYEPLCPSGVDWWPWHPPEAAERGPPWISGCEIYCIAVIVRYRNDETIFGIPIDLCVSKRPMSELWMHKKSERLQGHRACRRGHDDNAYAISCYVTFTSRNTLWHMYRMYRLLHDPCSGRMCLHRWTMQSSWICHTQKAGAKKAFFFSFLSSGFLSKTFLEQQRYVPRKTLPALGRMSPQSATFRHSEYGSIAEFGFVALDFWKILESSLVLDRFHKFLWN